MIRKVSKAMKKAKKSNMSAALEQRKWPTAALGAAAGFVNGLLGAGGGIIMVYAFSAVCDKDDNGVKDAFASTVAAILPISIVSALTYTFSGTVDLSLLPRYALPAVAGGLLGARLMGSISAIWLKRIFALTVIYAGINMIVRA